MFAWMFDRQAELQQEVAQLKEQRDSLAAENSRLASELVKHKTIQGRVNAQLSILSNECTQIEQRMQQMSEEIDTFQRMVVNR
jgi:hypothetical protein